MDLCKVNLINFRHKMGEGIYFVIPMFYLK